MGKLSVVATPIGNIEDMSFRGVRVLSEADVIYCEDSRVTRKLLDKYEIKTPQKVYHAHSQDKVIRDVIEQLGGGASIALVTDAGTPGISDPGSYLVANVRAELPEVKIEAIPGPSSVTAALSISGLPTDQFTFLGFVPHKKGRKTFFESLTDIKVRPIVFFESTHRIGKALESLRDQFGPEARILVASELTKSHEEMFDGTTAEAVEAFVDKRARGEFVIVVP